MLTEMLGKGGGVCELAKKGTIRCPLIVRPTSEDLITGQVFQLLRAIDARWWLPQILNRALGARIFRQQIYRQLRIDLWRNLPVYPRNMLPWAEGSTQVDVTIRWENPPTTVYIEAKFASELATKTVGSNGQQEFPGDQLIRNIRVGLWETGWIKPRQLFSNPTRQFCMLLWSPQTGHPLVSRYRHNHHVRAVIPHLHATLDLPRGPFVGGLDYESLTNILRCNRRWMNRAERQITDDLADYLTFKLNAYRSLKGITADANQAKELPPRVQERQVLLAGLGTGLGQLSADQGACRDSNCRAFTRSTFRYS